MDYAGSEYQHLSSTERNPDSTNICTKEQWMDTRHTKHHKDKSEKGDVIHTYVHRPLHARTPPGSRPKQRDPRHPP